MDGRSVNIIRKYIKHVNAKLKIASISTVRTTTQLISRERTLVNTSRYSHAVELQISHVPSIRRCYLTKDSLNLPWVVSKSHPSRQQRKKHGLAWWWHVQKIEHQDMVVFNLIILALAVDSRIAWAWKQNPSSQVAEEWEVSQYLIPTPIPHQGGWEKWHNRSSMDHSQPKMVP